MDKQKPLIDSQLSKFPLIYFNKPESINVNFEWISNKKYLGRYTSIKFYAWMDRWFFSDCP